MFGRWLVVVISLGVYWQLAASGAVGADAVTPRARVIVDNDFGGDCDGLYALAHQLLSPSVEVRGVIGSHNYPGGFYGYADTAEFSCQQVRDLLKVMQLEGKVDVYPGADRALGEAGEPVPTEGARFIVREAMRQDTNSPLYITCGAGLSDLASAYLMEPKIASRIRLIWIGGPEYEGQATPPPGNPQPEYNLGIDRRAAQVVFNESDIPIWQVPRNAYRQALVSHAELRYRLGTEGPLASHLSGRLDDLMRRANYSLGEAYVLGDSPLVLLTALQSAWEVDPSSSRYEEVPTPRLSDAGQYQKNVGGRSIRVYTQLDCRLMFEDFYAKVATSDTAAKMPSP